MDWLNKYGNYNNYIINHLINKIIIKAANNSAAMNLIANSSIAMSLIVNLSIAINAIAASPIAMSAIWSVDSARQAMWSSATARLALYNNPVGLKTVTVNSTPDLIDETPLNTDKDAGYLHFYNFQGPNEDWTAVNLNDGNKYLAWIHFYSMSYAGFFVGKIASYDQTTDLQITNGGSGLKRGNFNTTSNGLWIYFSDNAHGLYTNPSYGRYWYIKV